MKTKVESHKKNTNSNKKKTHFFFFNRKQDWVKSVLIQCAERRGRSSLEQSPVKAQTGTAAAVGHAAASISVPNGQSGCIHELHFRQAPFGYILTVRKGHARCSPASTSEGSETSCTPIHGGGGSINDVTSLQ